MTSKPLTILQWNARSLVANGQEFKKFVYELPVLPDLLCIQETWLAPQLQFKIPGYMAVRKDRVDGHGGGCCTFIGERLVYRELQVRGESECVAVEVGWTGGVNIVVMNFYNPCKELSRELLEGIVETGREKVVWCGDFNAHNTLWGSETTNKNGEAVEDFLDNQALVCLNDGTGTRINSSTGALTALDLTCVSSSIAGVCEWELLSESTVGSDHFPIVCRIGVDVGKEDNWYPGRWCWEKANWEKFNQMCEAQVENITVGEQVDEVARALANMLLAATSAAVPRSTGKQRKKAVPWWTQECTEAIQTRNRAFKVLRRTLTPEKVLEYQRTRAVARKVIKDAKRKCWKEYCSQIGQEVEVQEVWGMIKRMMGASKTKKMAVLVEGDRVASSTKEKAEMLKNAFVKAHSSANLGAEWATHRQTLIRQWGDVCKKRTEFESPLDAKITLFELKSALASTAQTSPGQDGVCYVMLKHVSDTVLRKILELYNKVWIEGRVPVTWKHALIVPIAKPGKDPSQATNYRPIALTLNLCKLMERILVNRLSYYMESKGLFSSYQCGFRKGRSTIDAMVRLETDIKKALAMKEVIVAVFFDIQKAYDMLWKEGLMMQLNRLGVGGRMYNWILSFLFGRTIQVRVGSDLSSVVEVENGTPQGSVISPVLFNIMINDIFKNVGSDIVVSLYADDGALWRRGGNVNLVVNKIQQAIMEVEKWAGEWGFKFSISKTCCEFFTNKKVGSNVKLYLYGKPLERVEVVRYLGLWFDKKLTWRIHIKKVETKCKRVINVIRCLSGLDWGANRASLMTMYYALVRSTIDYGCMVYGSAATTQLKILDRVQSQALRLCSGALRTSPVVSLQVELGETPLALRRKKLALAYWANLGGHEREHIAQTVLEQCWEYVAKRGWGFGWSIGSWAQEAGLQREIIAPTVPISPVPPWFFPQPTVDMAILQYVHEGTEMEVESLAGYVNQYIKDTHHPCTEIYTDGSKDPVTGRAGASMVVRRRGISLMWRLTDELSVYATEMTAIIKALEWVEEARPGKVVICSDSAAVINSIQSSKSCRMDLLYEVYMGLYRLERYEITVIFMWIPAHVGVWGNERADNMAKEALERPEPDITVHLGRGEMKVLIKRAVMKQWQMIWDRESKGRHLYNIQREVGKGVKVSGSRRDEVVITRLRIGHSLLNSTQFRFERVASGQCEGCTLEEETVQHVLFECLAYEQERKHWKDELLREGRADFNQAAVLGREANIRAILRYLTTTGLYARI